MSGKANEMNSDGAGRSRAGLRRWRWGVIVLVAISALGWLAWRMPPGGTELAWAGPPPGDPDTDPAPRTPVLFPVPLPMPISDMGEGKASAETKAKPGVGKVARAPVSPVIFPDQSIPLNFSHSQHLNMAEAPDCVDCHRKAKSSQSSLDVLVPTEASCRRCHAIDRTNPSKDVQPGQPPTRCDACHVDYLPNRPVARVEIPSPYIKFSHAVHTSEKVNIPCIHCHGDLAAEDVGLATRAQLPKMGLCLACHRGNEVSPHLATQGCTKCHLADVGGRVRTAYPSGLLIPSGVYMGAAHTAEFRTDHGAAAQNNSDYCAACHQQRFCADCHDGVVRPMDFHGNDYITLHVFEARRNQPDCSACHRLQSFCVGCHTRAGLSPDVRSGGEFRSDIVERRYHPHGYADSIRGANHHAWEAERNLRQCVSCHREQFCISCHAGPNAGPGAGSGISPHPPGWATSRRCQALRDRNPRVCLRCHVDLQMARCSR